MASNQYVNKVVYGGTTIIDISVNNDVTASDILTGKKTYGSSGAPITGTCNFDTATTDATAKATEILSGKTAYVNKTKVTGTMANKGSVTGTVSSPTGSYSIPSGYHDGGGTVSVDSTTKTNCIAANIKSGKTILGVVGTYAGEAVKAQSNKNATPYTDKANVITPDTGYDYLSQVTVAQIAYTETDNAAGGKTVTIGTVSPT